jgi:hypothetical protein
LDKKVPEKGEYFVVATAYKNAANGTDPITIPTIQFKSDNVMRWIEANFKDLAEHGIVSAIHPEAYR